MYIGRLGLSEWESTTRYPDRQFTVLFSEYKWGNFKENTVSLSKCFLHIIIACVWPSYAAECWKVHWNLNLVGHVIKSFEARRAFKKIWSSTNQVYIPMTFLAIVAYFLCLHLKWSMIIWTFGNTSRTVVCKGRKICWRKTVADQLPSQTVWSFYRTHETKLE